MKTLEKFMILKFFGVYRYEVTCSRSEGRHLT